jgi:hypothetical protein
MSERASVHHHSYKALVFRQKLNNSWSKHNIDNTLTGLGLPSISSLRFHTQYAKFLQFGIKNHQLAAAAALRASTNATSSAGQELLNLDICLKRLKVFSSCIFTYWHIKTI